MAAVIIDGAGRLTGRRRAERYSVLQKVEGRISVSSEVRKALVRFVEPPIENGVVMVPRGIRLQLTLKDGLVRIKNVYLHQDIAVETIGPVKGGLM